jgi:hypothetical protein
MSSLQYRLHRPEDEPQLLRLWRDHSGWDQVSAAQWAHRMMHPPFGPATIIVGEDPADGAILAQFAFLPVLVQIGDREVQGSRPFAPIVSAERASRMRMLNPKSHPVVAMYLAAAELLRARGDALTYTIPDPRWSRFLRYFPVLSTATFPLYSRALPLAAPLAVPDGFTVEAVTHLGAEIDALWARARTLGRPMLVRDSRLLPWKIGQGDYRVLALREDGVLRAVVAARGKGDHQWLICDLVADDASSTRAALIAATRAGDERVMTAPGAPPFRKVAILATEHLIPHLDALGFTRDTYDFTLVVQQFDETVPAAAFAPNSWYVSAND